MATILVVDDEPHIREMITASLEIAGHEVVSAEDGEHALRKLKRRRYDLVLLDIMMPKMDGYEVLDQLRRMPSREGTRVIVLTAKHDPEGVAREIEAGAADHLAKPFLPSELEAAIERVLDDGPHVGDERRRILSSDAEMYGSMQGLVESARTSNDA